jgi:hypothetical protein
MVAIEDTTERMIHIQEKASAVRALLSAMNSQTEHREVTT